MQDITVFAATLLTGNADGSAKKTISTSFSTLGAKSMEIYLLVTEVDADTEIIIKWSKSADGINWYDISSAIVDTGAGADASKGVYIGDNGSTLVGAFVRLGITIVKRANATIHTATVTVNAVLKPF